MPPATATELQQALGGIHRLVERDIARFWAAQDLSNPAQVRDNFLRFIPTLVQTYGDGAAAIAAAWFDELRADEMLRDNYRAKMAQVIPAEFTEQRVRFGASSLWGERPEEFALFVADIAKGWVTQAFGDTIILSSAMDPASPRWARVPNATACDFCRMLASRGFEYTSKEAATRVQGRGVERYTFTTKRGKVRERGGGVRARGSRSPGETFHGSCRCTAMPVWDEAKARRVHGYDPEALLREYRASQEPTT